MNEKRIYVIVAKTVQNPLQMVYVSTKPRHYVLRPTPETKTIVQPVGRIGAQIGHVVSKMRMYRLIGIVSKASKTFGSHNGPTWDTIFDKLTDAADAITTINLQVPDSFQLEFYHNLMLKAGLRVHFFYDQNPEYGPGVVKTAICTEPIEKSKLIGITDYLELWSEKPCGI